MRHKLVAFSFVIVLANASAFPAISQERVCKVTDPTGTPLNVRHAPNGRVIGTLRNDTEVYIERVASDDRGRAWAQVSSYRRGRRRIVGWVFREFISCYNRSAGAGMNPGYYFTISMCRACVYPEWHDDAIRLLRAKGIRAIMGKGYESRSSNQPFAPISAFEMQFDSNVGSDSELLAQVELYVGPFQSEESATRALDSLHSVLASIQRKRNRMDEGFGKGWPISDNQRVRHTSGNHYEYGFFFIKGYRLLN